MNNRNYSPKGSHFLRRILAIALLILCASSLASAQSDKEKEVIQLTLDYEQAYLKKDVAFFERLLAPDYTFASEVGTTDDRAKALEYLRTEKQTPTFNLVSSKSDDMRARVMGDMAVVTGTYTVQTTAVGAAAGEPHTDAGRFTIVYAKRDGRWMVIAEHLSERQHDRKLMEQQVLKLGQDYGKMIERGDVGSIERLLAGDYLFTNERGQVRNKAEDLATYKTGDTKIESAKTFDQKVRVIGNNAVIETGSFHVKGTRKGKPFDVTERYTATWVWRGGRWQLASDHNSTISPTTTISKKE
ncbi:MAG: nuclear transport factor 2 family protein [Acidobacteriota bacterium]|nr:nuclear transport factor 2 family protein [Acidobacteriota bacterium]